MKNRVHIKNAHRIVIKVGTSTLTHETGKLNLLRIKELITIMSDLQNQGKEIIFVTSGAIGVGVNRLKLSEKPKDIETKQATAAVGQAVLMQIYEKYFMEYNQYIAQVLLTKDILKSDKRKTNAINTLKKLIHLGVIPIINENDTIATEEIEFGDNDSLSAIVATLVDADLLILLSDIDGLYTEDPNINHSADLIDFVNDIEKVEDYASGALSNCGTGGMATKIEASKISNNAGVDMIICNGNDPYNIVKIIEGELIGTLFRHWKENN